MQNFIDLIRSRTSFVLTGHEHPDGDCLGSQAGLHHLLTGLGKEVTIVNPDPVSPGLAFLAERTPFHIFRTEEDLPRADVLILLDCAFVSRLGGMAATVRERAGTGDLTIAVVDHHVGSEDGDGTVFLVDSTAPATGALVHGLYRELGVPLHAAAAEGIFVSLISDTGWFRYSNTDASVLALAAELVDAGAEPTRIYDLIYRRNDQASIGLLAEGLQATRFLLDGRLAVTTLDKSMMDRVGRAGFDTDVLMEPVRSVAGVEVVALLKERFDGALKLSLRAQGDVDVQAIAAGYGGGGHRKAAGATVHLPIDTVVGRLEREVRDALTALAEKTAT